MLEHSGSVRTVHITKQVLMLVATLMATNSFLFARQGHFSILLFSPFFCRQKNVVTGEKALEVG